MEIDNKKNVANHQIYNFLKKFYDKEFKDITIKQLPKNSASDRVYYRIYFKDGSTQILAYTTNLLESETFLYFSKELYKNGANVPKIFYESSNKSIYTLEDFGSTSLFNLIDKRENQNLPQNVLDYCFKALKNLVYIQNVASKNIDYSKAYPIDSFSKQAILWDFNYFKYCFLKPLNINFFEKTLEEDFIEVIDRILKIKAIGFMYRDFQSRNVMIKDDKPYFIDYQGGRKGPLVYDAVSFIYQAKAKFSDKNKQSMLEYYYNELSNYIEYPKEKFKIDCLLMRLERAMQTLGAYGFRGIIEHNKYFLESIIPGIQNFVNIINSIPNNLLKIEELRSIATQLDDYATKYIREQEKIENSDKLTLEIISFSYFNNQIPKNDKHGGGFVFDCRSLPNPYWVKELRLNSGNETPVINFLSQKPEVQSFMDNVTNLVSNALDEYINRNYKYLMVSFGCTGGQHRSVFCAEELYKILKNKYNNIYIKINHLRENQWKK